MRLFGLLGLFFAIAFGADGEAAAIDLTTTWAGILSLIIFVVGYFFIAAEENFHIDKAKPAIFIGTFMFLLIGVYMLINGMNVHLLENEVNHLILEIAQIVFFLMVAMTFIEALVERDVFNALKYNLVSKGYTYRKLFWLTGILAFFISPVADNLTTALILSTIWRYHYTYGLGSWQVTIFRLFRTFPSFIYRLVCDSVFTFTHRAKYCASF